MRRRLVPALGAVVGGVLAVALFLGGLEAIRTSIAERRRLEGLPPTEHDQPIVVYLALLLGPVAVAAGAGLGWRLLDDTPRSTREDDWDSDPDRSFDEPDEGAES